jgi:hypothetical protein
MDLAASYFESNGMVARLALGQLDGQAAFVARPFQLPLMPEQTYIVYLSIPKQHRPA